MMTVAPGDVFLGTAGYRESIRWVSGHVPVGGLKPDNIYWMIADSGIVGELAADPPTDMAYFGSVRHLGAVRSARGEKLNIRQFALPKKSGPYREQPVYLVVGTCGNIGKTTAGIAILRSLLAAGHKTVIALKATGTSSFEEIARYRDFGAAQAFDPIDFGLPTTFPSSRDGIDAIFAGMLDLCLSQPGDALVIECGGDLFGASVPEFLACLKARQIAVKTILTAGDAPGAMGAKRVLDEIGLEISLITGPCTETPTLRERTESLCGVPAMNLFHRLGQGSRPPSCHAALPG